MSDPRHVTRDKKDTATCEAHACHPPTVTGRLAAFTLIEIMIVVAIMGLIAAIGVPSILQTFRKEGMRKAVSNVEDICAEARTRAILQNQKTAVVFYPPERRFGVEGVGGGVNASSGRVTFATLPPGVEIAMLDINLQDYGASPWARVFFYPDGTSDEMTLVLHSSDDWRKITLEFSTGLATVSDVNR
ncbi:MAG: prepilin-type N-terminal cleavage/methylation domain-containing protein [Verrucomicrobiota bacterium]|jgi:prepilin-type N-terminal cleavage/methylation domain-containing protein